MVPGNDLRNLRKGGPNGIVTVVIGLKWWGEAGYDRETWRNAVVDMRECFEVLVSTELTPPKKRRRV